MCACIYLLQKVCVRNNILRIVYVFATTILLKLYACTIKKCLQTSYFRIGDIIMMKFDDKDFIAQQIRLHRKKAKMTQEELAEKVDLSVQHISRIESACYVPSLKSFFMIVSVLQIDLRNFGFNMQTTSNSQKDELIYKITNATDAELIFYDNVMNAITNSLAKVKKELL